MFQKTSLLSSAAPHCGKLARGLRGKVQIGQKVSMENLDEEVSRATPDEGFSIDRKSDVLPSLLVGNPLNLAVPQLEKVVGNHFS